MTTENKIPTKEKLAKVLREAGLEKLADNAAQALYDDFESPIAMPINQLVKDLMEAGRPDLAKRAMDGEWDATKEESEDWFSRTRREGLI